MHASLLLAALLPTTFAHFVLNYPTSLGFDDDRESIGPCGGYDIVFGANDTNVSVESFAIASRSTHPQANWLFRATLSTAEPFNWTNLLPVVQQSGLGDFCIPSFSAPSNFVGQRGVLQIVQSAVDGNLYQCAAVNFVAGAQSGLPSQCTNATGITASLTSMTSLSGTSDNSTSPSASGSSSATSAAPSATSTQSSDATQLVGGLLAVMPAALLLL